MSNPFLHGLMSEITKEAFIGQLKGLASRYRTARGVQFAQRLAKVRKEWKEPVQSVHRIARDIARQEAKK